MPDPLQQSFSQDAEIIAVAAFLRKLDPKGARTAQVLRNTLDQLYDGQRTGRYRWDQLFKTEKTHCGTLVEINLQREFEFQDGESLDYRIAQTQVDCKYSQRLGGWMIPPEANSHICLLLWCDDEKALWSMGIVRITAERLNSGGNRDQKATLNPKGRSSIAWLFNQCALPPNVLLQLEKATVEYILEPKSGQERINRLFRSTLGRLVTRGVVATVAQQDDYMKRVRANGGARTALQSEGIVILGQYSSHALIARTLGVPVPGPGDSVSVRLAPSKKKGLGVVKIEGNYWKMADACDSIVAAPHLPSV